MLNSEIRVLGIVLVVDTSVIISDSIFNGFGNEVTKFVRSITRVTREVGEIVFDGVKDLSTTIDRATIACGNNRSVFFWLKNNLNYIENFDQSKSSANFKNGSHLGHFGIFNSNLVCSHF